MKPDEKNPKVLLDQITAQIREENLDPVRVRETADRVWARLSRELPARSGEPMEVERIEGCADVQALIPSYLAGRLPAARILLVEDHTRGCLPCRRALEWARSGRPPVPRSSPGARSTAKPVVWWGIAAAVTIGVLVAGAAVVREFLWIDPARSLARVEAIEGSLYRVSGNDNLPLAPDQEIPGGEVFRTAKDSRAVVSLADGSRVEMNERSELAVSARRSSTTLRLARGSLIVQAAKQGRGHLYVATNDCRVSVTGTVFSVNHGIKGSRVSVIEGEVHVEHSGSEAVLRPGDQVSTHPTLENVPVEREIAWSQDVDRYLSLLRELTRLRRDLELSLPRPELRHSTRLADLAPDATIVYAAFPNLGQTLVEAHRLLRERIEESPILRQWWEETLVPARVQPRLEETIDRIHAFSDRLGPEIAVTLQVDEAGRFEGVLVLAELTDPAGFRPFLAEELRRLDASTPDRSAFEIVEDPRTAAVSSPETLFFWVHGDLLAAATSLPQLRRLAETIDTPTSDSVAATPFHSRIAEAYGEGAGWLMVVDVEKVLSRSREPGSAGKADALRRMGLLDVQHLIMEGKETGDTTLHRAVVTFAEPRRGIASWLAPPAPMGSLEFISPDATLAAAFVTKDPVALTQDIFDLLETSDPDFRQHLSEFESRQGVDVLADFAAPLGGEFTFALDGPILPKPAWKLVLEVYDPARFEGTLEWIVRELNRIAANAGEQPFRLETEQQGDRTYHTLHAPRVHSEVHYTFVDGYFLAAPARSVLDAAIRTRDSGAHLSGSSRFTALLPQDGQVNFSAIAYQNLAPVLGPLAGQLQAAAPGLSPQQQQLVATLMADSRPTLAYAYGEEDRIVFAGNRPGGLLGSSLGTLVGLGGLMQMGQAVESTLEEEAPKVGSEVQ